MFLTPQDFTGKYELHSGMYSQNTIQNYIDIYVEKYLIELLGAQLYDLFLADLTPSDIPESPLYLDIFNPFHIDGNIHETVISEGMIQMLKGFVYFEYIKDLTNQTTINGTVIPQNENSITATSLYSMYYNRFNEAVRTYRAIQYYILTNMSKKGGQIVLFSLLNPGTGYAAGSGLTTSGGSGSGCTVDITETGGIIDTVVLNNVGVNYSVNDVLTISGGNNDAQILVEKVGADYRKFYGRRKELMTWI